MYGRDTRRLYDESSMDVMVIRGFFFLPPPFFPTQLVSWFSVVETFWDWDFPTHSVASQGLEVSCHL